MPCARFAPTGKVGSEGASSVALLDAVEARAPIRAPSWTDPAGAETGGTEKLVSFGKEPGSRFPIEPFCFPVVVVVSLKGLGASRFPSAF